MDANEPERSRGRLKHEHNLIAVTSESPDLKKKKINVKIKIKKALLLFLLTSYKMKQRLSRLVTVSRLFQCRRKGCRIRQRFHLLLQ